MRRLFLLGLAACGSSNPAAIDAAEPTDGKVVVVDAPPSVDAPPVIVDAPEVIVDGTPAVGMKHHYVANKVVVPQNNTQAQSEGLDLNGDGAVDNQFGQILATFAGQGFNTQTAYDTAVAQGKVIILAELQTDDFTTQAAAGFTTFTGTNPNPPACAGSADTTCGKHLLGTASFTVAPPEDAPLVGNLVQGTLVTSASGGKLPLSLAIGNATFTVELVGARAKVSGASATGLTAILAGGILQSDIQTKVYPAFAATMNGVVQASCTMPNNPPGCGCASGGSGAQVIGLFDTNHDCKVSVDEVANNQLITSLFMPDLTVDGQKALSVGIQVTAVAATFTP